MLNEEWLQCYVKPRDEQEILASLPEVLNLSSYSPIIYIITIIPIILCIIIIIIAKLEIAIWVRIHCRKPATWRQHQYFSPIN